VIDRRAAFVVVHAGRVVDPSRHAAVAMLDGTWSRLKACRECRWAFYDHSRNGAGSWCSMAVCGSRVKQRAYHARRGASGSAPRASPF
jgi:predicted RNA-binding Zn ribbon-like protein